MTQKRWELNRPVDATKLDSQSEGKMNVPFMKSRSEEAGSETATALPLSGPESNEPHGKEMEFRTKVILAALLVVVALLSFFVIGNIADNPETHSDTIAALDDSRNNVLLMTAGALGVSTAASILPADAGKPVSEALTQIISGLAVILAVIMLEKYLLTVFGFAAFKILIPIGCLLLGVALLMRPYFAPRQTLVRLASKSMVFGLVIFLAIPLSVGVSKMVQQTYQTQFEETIAVSENISNAAAEGIDATANEAEDGNGNEEEKGGNVLENLGTAIAGIPDAAAQLPENIASLPKSVADSAVNSVSGAADKLKSLVGRYIEGFAIMVVTSCLIPIIVILVFFWLANVLLGINTGIPRMPRLPMAKPGKDNNGGL